MTLKELLKACADGKMPKVKCNRFIKGAKSDVGQVVVIKQGTSTAGFFGCAVDFPGLAWDTWFHETPGTDKRNHHMSELTFIE